MAQRRVLQIGLGGFGRNHLRAWSELGRTNDILVAELDVSRHRECLAVGMSADQVGTDYRSLLENADAVDIVTPSTSHYAIAREALSAGKDVFVEKPMTMTSAESLDLASLAKSTGRLIQVGYYYRYHPISVFLKDQVTRGALGTLRYLSGSFMGFKRARTDVGVTHTDGVHFIDLFNWLIGSPPVEVYAVIRDHFGRGMEDLSVVLLRYPGGTVAKVESGYIQPGRWHDKVVPHAMTTKEISVSGSAATAEADFETETAVLHDIHHEYNQVTWAPISKGSRVPKLTTASPVQMIAAELGDFMASLETRQAPMCGPVSAGLVVAKIVETLYESARQNRPIAMEWTPEEASSLGA